MHCDQRHLIEATLGDIQEVKDIIANGGNGQLIEWIAIKDVKQRDQSLLVANKDCLKV